jgi:hypothetical protein
MNETPSVRDALQAAADSGDFVRFRELLREVLDAQEALAGANMAEDNAIKNYSGDKSAYTDAAIKALERVSAAEKAARDALSKQEAATPASGDPDWETLCKAYQKTYASICVELVKAGETAFGSPIEAIKRLALKAAQPVPLNVAAQEQVYSEAPAEGQRAYSPVAVAPDAPSDVVAVHSQHCDEHAECDDLRERMAALLTGVANALRGDPGPLRRWSWHDLPVRAAVMREQRDSAQADFKLLAEAFADAYQPRTALDATPAPQEPAEPVRRET